MTWLLRMEFESKKSMFKFLDETEPIIFSDVIDIEYEELED